MPAREMAVGVAGQAFSTGGAGKEQRASPTHT